jgi:hypothetical protein
MNHLKFIKMIILFFKIIYSFLKNNDGLQVKKRKAKKKNRSHVTFFVSTFLHEQIACDFLSYYVYVTCSRITRTHSTSLFRLTGGWAVVVKLLIMLIQQKRSIYS